MRRGAGGTTVGWERRRPGDTFADARSGPWGGVATPPVDRQVHRTMRTTGPT